MFAEENTSRFIAKQLSPDVDSARLRHVTDRYLVASAERTGSTLLCEFLWATKLAGYPAEYFSPAFLKPLSQRWGCRGLGAYVAALYRKRVGANGVFGFKLHFSQFEKRFCDEKGTAHGLAQLNLFFPGCKIIRISRRDRIAQALSFYRALQSKQWILSHGDVPAAQAATYDFPTILKCWRRVDRAERKWARTLQNFKGDLLDLTYEDLTQDMASTVGDVFAWLGVPFDVGLVARPVTRRQADETTERLRERFLADIKGHHDKKLSAKIIESACS